MALYSVFIAGYNGGTTNQNEGLIQTGGLSARPVTGTLFQGVNAATPAAAFAAVQSLTGTQEQQLSHTFLVSNDTTA